MLSNLTHIQLFKLSHSRFVRWGAVAWVLATAAFFALFVYLSRTVDYETTEVFKNLDRAEASTVWVTLILNLIMGITNIFIVGSVLSLITGHYEYRERVNISGIVRSPVAWAMAELAAIFFLVAFIATVEVLVVILFIFATDNWLVSMSYRQWGIIYIGMIVACLYMAMPSFAISKIIKKRSLSIGISILFIFARFFFLIFLAGMYTGFASTSDLSNSYGPINTVSSFINNPGNAIVNAGFDNHFGMSKGVFMVLAPIRLMLMPVIGLIAAGRKKDL